MKGRLKADGVTAEHVSIGQVHVHVEGTFGGGTVALKYANELGSKQLIPTQTEADYNNHFDGGANYDVNDTIELVDGSVITVNAVTSTLPPPVYTDDFNRADGALTTPWSQLDTASAVIDTNVAKIVEDSLVVVDLADLGFTGTVSSYAVEFDITGKSTAETLPVFSFHHSGTGTADTDRGIGVEIYIDNSGGYVQVYNGSAIPLPYVLFTVDAFPAHLRIELNANVVTVYQAGVQVATCTITENMPAATNIFGIGHAITGNTSYMTIDNLEFHNLGGVGESGIVSEFTVTSAGDLVDIEENKAFPQATTSGSGTGFSLTPRNANTEELWRAIAGESYTAAADKLLALPNGTKVRLELTGATAPNIFYEVR